MCTNGETSPLRRATFYVSTSLLVLYVEIGEYLSSLKVLQRGHLHFAKATFNIAVRRRIHVEGTAGHKQSYESSKYSWLKLGARGSYPWQQSRAFSLTFHLCWSCDLIIKTGPWRPTVSSITVADIATDSWYESLEVTKRRQWCKIWGWILYWIPFSRIFSDLNSRNKMWITLSNKPIQSHTLLENFQFPSWNAQGSFALA